MKDMPFIIFGMVILFFAIKASGEAVRRFAVALKEHAPEAFRQFNDPSLTMSQNKRHLRAYVHSRDFERLGIPLVTQLGQRAAYTQAAMFIFAITTVPSLAGILLFDLFHLK